MLDFSNDNKWYSLGKDIWIQENFLSPEEISYFRNILDNMSEEKWNEAKNPIEWYNGKTSAALEELKPINNRITDIVAPSYEPTPNLSFTRMFPGDSMHEHKDTCEEEEATSNDDFGTCAITRYGVVVYVNDDFEGGELYYPELDLKYTPKAGDLVIHGALINHGVAEVTSGTRYAYASFLVDKGAINA